MVTGRQWATQQAWVKPHASGIGRAAQPEFRGDSRQIFPGRNLDLAPGGKCVGEPAEIASVPAGIHDHDDPAICLRADQSPDHLLEVEQHPAER